MTVRYLMAVAVAAAVLFAGCGSQVPSSQPSQSAQQPGPSVSTDGPPADLDFTAMTVDGKTFDGTTLAGKPVLLWFWAPWCPICADEVYDVKDLVETFGDRLTIVGVGGLDTAAHIRKGRELISGTTQLVDADGKVWRHFGVTAQATYLIVMNGKLVYDSSKNPDPIHYEVKGLLH
jgi:peroxiredoxin